MGSNGDRPTQYVMNTWNSLPMELRFMIFEYLAACGPGHLSACAAVCKEWQELIERRNFCQLKLRSTCVEGLTTMVTDRTRPLVQHIWLHVAIPPYTCLICYRQESRSAWVRNNRMIKGAVLKLFAILQTWDSTDGITLELSTNSPSDPEHWFKNYCFGDGSQGARNCGHSDHGWSNGTRLSFPSARPLDRLFETIDLTSRLRLLRVDIITRLVIRRQLRRRLTPSSLRMLLDKLPRLERLIFEPWRWWDPELRQAYDGGEGVFRLHDALMANKSIEYRQILQAGLPSTLKRLSIFEDFDEIHMQAIQRSIWPPLRLGLARIGFPQLASTVARQSLHLTHLSVSFLIEAFHFIRPHQRFWEWEHLEFVSLTSELLRPGRDNIMIWTFLFFAALVASRMPRLKEMILWNGGKGHACVFRYRREKGAVTVRSTWGLILHHTVETIWSKVLFWHTGSALHFDVRTISGATILCHGDAIHELGLPSEVIDAISVSQMRREARMV
ncbi:uncharacterized protein NECHADRAFT_86390 [Fusarium vanettenii 77-13-4]|uniref:Uncharacterized protein n=1 Tax=Fusarium vanettenii (strain ATCC MYA-4622 / CBS 123669 / FGSC 9596 / NRRL 45880 / 77-13-4) TaxID=660122 RepID=C7ZF49_FUSV7|nr:uncharacterized protein NECHADRAFT_86390 [Fusarium vanettenii 77-13-4]EEU37405.1 hypothetical protein NECHADRAFT_86390 [Fusarium vanettenii 77-13-4]